MTLLSLSRTNRTVSALNSAENFRRFRFFVPMTLSYRTSRAMRGVYETGASSLRLNRRWVEGSEYLIRSISDFAFVLPLEIA